MAYDWHLSHVQSYVTLTYRTAQFLYKIGSFQRESMFHGLSVDFATERKTS